MANHKRSTLWETVLDEPPSRFQVFVKFLGVCLKKARKGLGVPLQAWGLRLLIILVLFLLSMCIGTLVAKYNARTVVETEANWKKWQTAFVNPNQGSVCYPEGSGHSYKVTCTIGSQDPNTHKTTVVCTSKSCTSQ